jgi:hypothetical protein
MITICAECQYSKTRFHIYIVDNEALCCARENVVVHIDRFSGEKTYENIMSGEKTKLKYPVCGQVNNGSCGFYKKKRQKMRSIRELCRIVGGWMNDHPGLFLIGFCIASSIVFGVTIFILNWVAS